MRKILLFWATILLVACNFLFANCSTGSFSLFKGGKSTNYSTNVSREQKHKQLYQLIADIRKCLGKSLKKMNSENAKKVTEVQEAIMMLWGAPFWKELQQKSSGNNGQQMVMITLKDFHEKYESTLMAELVFVEIKKLLPVLSDYKGKLEKIGKNANAQKLKEYKDVMKKEINLKNAIEKRPSETSYVGNRKRELELEKIAADSKKYVREELKGIPPGDLGFVDKIVKLEGKVVKQLSDISNFFRSVKENRIASDRFSLSKDEIVLRVVGPYGEELKVTELYAWLKRGKYNDTYYWLLDGTKDRFALNYVQSWEYNRRSITPLEWMKRHKDLKDLESCAFSIKYLVKGDIRTSTIEIDLREKENMDFLGAKSGRFVVNAGKYYDSYSYYSRVGSIKVDEHAWDEDTSKA